jgi:hypothetical protein
MIRHCEEAQPTKQSRVTPIEAGLLRFVRNNGGTRRTGRLRSNCFAMSQSQVRVA